MDDAMRAMLPATLADVDHDRVLTLDRRRDRFNVERRRHLLAQMLRLRAQIG